MYFKENFTELHAVEKCLERRLSLWSRWTYNYPNKKMTIKIFISIYRLYKITGLLNDIFLHAFNVF